MAYRRRFGRGGGDGHRSQGARKFTFQDALAQSGREGMAWGLDTRTPWESARLMSVLYQLLRSTGVVDEVRLPAMKPPGQVLSPWSGLTRSKAFGADIMGLMKSVNAIVTCLRYSVRTEEEFLHLWVQVGFAALELCQTTYGEDTLKVFVRAAVQEANDARVSLAPSVVSMPPAHFGALNIDPDSPLSDFDDTGLGGPLKPHAPSSPGGGHGGAAEPAPTVSGTMVEAYRRLGRAVFVDLFGEDAAQAIESSPVYQENVKKGNIPGEGAK